MNREPDEGFVLHISKTEVQNGVIHAEPCECTDLIQVGAQETKAINFVEDFVTFLASRHNAIYVGCTDCAWEGFVGPGEKAGGEDDKVVVDEGACPQCSGDLINLQKQECDDDKEALELHYDEAEIVNHD